MATATANPPVQSRLVAWLPWLALLAWAGGAVGIWYLGQRRQWSPGENVLAGCAWLVVLLVAARDFVRGMFGPVFAYEMVRLGRRRLTFIMRLLYVLAVLGMLALMYTAWLEDVGYFRASGPAEVPYQRMSNFATEFFYVFLGVQFGVAVFLTPAYVAGCIADEKERKTLEFLLATDLRNHEIVFGKVAARVANLLMFVLAGLPVVAFMQLFGGIDPDLLLAGTAATLITVIGLSAVSVAFSVMLRKPRDAIALAYLASALYFVGSIVLAMSVVYLQVLTMRTGAANYTFLGMAFDDLDLIDVLKTVTDWLAAGNILYVISSLMMPPMVGGAGFSPAAVATALFRYSVFWGLVIALFLGYSVWRLRTLALHQRYGAVKPSTGKGVLRPRRNLPAVGDDPMFWKEVFAEGGVRGGCVGWGISILIAVLVFMWPAIIVWMTFFEPRRYGARTVTSDWQDFAESMNVWARIATGLIGFLLMIAAAVRGASAVSGERDRDTWVSLMSTPLTAWEMLRAKWLGVILGLRRGYFALLLVWATALAVGGIDPPMLIPTVLCLAVYISAFAWIGIYCSITARTTLIATVRSMMAALFLSGGFWVFIGLCCAIPLGLVASSRDVDSLEYALNLLLGLTPPFVLGWMPLLEYDRGAMGPFSWEESHSLGPLNPVFGFFVWFGFNWVLGLASWQAFRKATNRERDELAGRLPKRYDPELDDEDDAPPPPRRAKVVRRPKRNDDDAPG